MYSAQCIVATLKKTQDLINDITSIRGNGLVAS